MTKIARIKIALSVALRFLLADVKDSFNFDRKDYFKELVKNPNPKGRQPQVSRAYAEEWLREHGRGKKEPSKKENEVTPIGSQRAEYNKKRLQHFRDNNIKHNNSFHDLNAEDKTKIESISKKKGSEVSKEEVDFFVSKFESAYEEMKNLSHYLHQGAQSYAGRLKDESSLFTKMKGRFAERTMESVNDIIGTRCICKNLEEQRNLVQHIYENGIILEHDDSVDTNQRPDGYRAHHFTVQSKSGRLVELQVKTVNQQQYSDWTHPIYKSPLKNDPEVKQYTKALSDYVFEIDSGREPKQQPQIPKQLKEYLDKEGLPEFNFKIMLSRANADKLKSVRKKQVKDLPVPLGRAARWIS